MHGIKWATYMNNTAIQNVFDNLPTGSDLQEGKPTKTYKFEKYEVNVLLDDFGKFLGIESIKINKDFLESHHKRASEFNFHDYYGE